MKVLHDGGARTIAQNEETCVVFGMPKEAIKLQAVDDILPLESLARAILQFDSRA
jgi:two-component system chemotaxis response regulator CheB